MQATKADKKLVICYSYMEKLTQKLVDIFIIKIYVYKDKKVEFEWNFRKNNLALIHHKFCTNLTLNEYQQKILSSPKVSQILEGQSDKLRKVRSLWHHG